MSKFVKKLTVLGPQVVKGAIKVSQEKGVPALQKFIKYARVELPPPRWSEVPQVRKGFGDLLTAVRTQKWREATLKEATVNALITIEVICWFFVGECIGKRGLIGYYIPGAIDYEVHI